MFVLYTKYYQVEIKKKINKSFSGNLINNILNKNVEM